MYPIDSASQGSIREPKPGAEDNVQPRFELFLLGEDQKKVTEEPDTRESFSICQYDGQNSTLEELNLAALQHFGPSTRLSQPAFIIPYLASISSYLANASSPGMPSTSIFTFNKEDHTLGNMLRSRLLQMEPQVIFAGYKVPHPLFRYATSISWLNQPTSVPDASVNPAPTTTYDETDTDE